MNDFHSGTILLLFCGLNADFTSYRLFELSRIPEYFPVNEVPAEEVRQAVAGVLQ
jgi:hypothetical protein